MKRYVIIFLLLIACQTTNAQTAADVFRDDARITLLGLDFSLAKFMGDEALQDDEDVRRFVTSINYLLRDEADKYDFARALRKEKLDDGIDVTLERNKNLIAKERIYNVEEFMRPLNRSELDGLVASYDFKGKEGIGLLLIVDKLNKYEKKAYVWYTFVNMNTKKILFNEYKTAAPAGFGVRNYWARAIHLNIIEIKARDYKTWKAKYGG